jgi:hypothetical protein
MLEWVARLANQEAHERDVRSLGCIVLPSDGLALFLFQAPSEARVRCVSELAEIPFDRVVESINVGLGT